MTKLPPNDCLQLLFYICTSEIDIKLQCETTEPRQFITSALLRPCQITNYYHRLTFFVKKYTDRLPQRRPQAGGEDEVPVWSGWGGHRGEQSPDRPEHLLGPPQLRHQRGRGGNSAVLGA